MAAATPVSCAGPRAAGPVGRVLALRPALSVRLAIPGWLVISRMQRPGDRRRVTRVTGPAWSWLWHSLYLLNLRADRARVPGTYPDTMKAT